MASFSTVDDEFDAFHVDAERGVYFSGDPNYASGYGDILYRCRVILNNPARFSQEEAEADMEIDRRELIADGFDGRIVEYDNGEMDVIAFYAEQIEILERT